MNVRDSLDLPGVRGLVRTVVETAARGSHVAVVVPQYLVALEGFTDALAGLIGDEFVSRVDRTDRVYPWNDEGTTVAEAVAVGLGLELADFTVAELVRHPELRGAAMILDALDFAPSLACQVSKFFTQLNDASRGTTDRPVFVAIITSGMLPTFAGNSISDMHVTTVWWWNVITRWDITFLGTEIAMRRRMEPGLTTSLFIETLSECAQWDLRVASKLADSWDGASSDLPRILDELPAIDPPEIPRTLNPPGQVRPPDSVVDAWNHGAVEAEGRGFATALWVLNDERAERIRRAIWSAQCRVLLPWIEISRAALARRCEADLDPRILDEERAGQHQNDVLEIGPVHRLMSRYYRLSDPAAVEFAGHLRSARNSLAHLRPLEDDAVRDLITVSQS